MIQNSLPPIHPGEILREEVLTELGLSAHALAMALHVPASRIGDILRERRGITADTALRLAHYLGTTPQYWLNLQTSYDLKVAATTLSASIEREIQPRENAAGIQIHLR